MRDRVKGQGSSLRCLAWRGQDSTPCVVLVFFVQNRQTCSRIAPGAVELFEYAQSSDAPFVPSWSGWEQAPDAAGVSEQRLAKAPLPKPIPAHLEQKMAEETRRAFEAGRTRGLEEGRHAEREAQAETRAASEEERIRQAIELTESFARQRDGYFEMVEREVVKLALAVAARILRREAQADPLLLMGAVRVALGQLSASTEVQLHVPAAELDLWTEAIALLPNLAVKPRIVGGEGMRLGDCTIATSLGKADLGLRAQLGEMERSFFDGSWTRSESAPEPAP